MTNLSNEQHGALPPTIFVTGIAGFVGGNVVSLLIEEHPDYKIIGLVRNDEQATLVKARWPHIETVIGTLDTPEVLIEQASKADVAIEMASSDHPEGSKALIEGLSKKKGGPGYLIHISGTGVLVELSEPSGAGPTPKNNKIYNDVADIAAITSLGPTYLHGPCDVAVLETGKELKVPTAIVCPPLIYGIGKGPVKTRSIQLPWLAETILKRGKAFIIEEGKDYFDFVHVDDTAAALVLLTEEALKPNGGKAQWGPEGYYFCEAGELTWNTATPAMAKILHQKGAIPSAGVDKISVDDAKKLHPFGFVLWGGTARSRAERLRKLGWQPKGKSVWDMMEEIVEDEIARFKEGRY